MEVLEFLLTFESSINGDYLVRIDNSSLSSTLMALIMVTIRASKVFGFSKEMSKVGVGEATR